MLVESDFQREYRIDLVNDIGRLSWRRFTALLRGLGPNSASAYRVQERRLAERTGKPVRVVDGGPDQATAVFSALFGGG